MTLYPYDFMYVDNGVKMKPKKMFSIDYREREVRRAMGTLPLTGNFIPRYFIENDSVNEAINTELIEDLVDFNHSENIVSNKEFKQVIKNCLDSLTPRESKVLRLRFGIDTNVDRTLENVADMMNLTRERIRQIEEKALRKMRHPNRNVKIKIYLGDYDSYSGIYKDINEPAPDLEEYKEWYGYEKYHEAMVAWNIRVMKAKKILDNAKAELTSHKDTKALRKAQE